jgi:putative transposase
MRKYRRRLPHIDVPGHTVFVTWRLYGSLPKGRSFEAEELTSGEAFVAYDRLLDTARVGPIHMKQPEVAEVVHEQIQVVAAQELCTIHAYSIMPNHVHVLWTPKISLPILVGQVKGPTAVAANRLLKATGQPFWQAEYFDRLTRDGKEFDRIKSYIEWNPVKAGLVAAPEQYRWSSAYGGRP